MNIDLKQINKSDFGADVSDVRDGLSPYMRYILAAMQSMNDEIGGKFIKSHKLSDAIAKELGAEPEKIYESLINATRPRCRNPLVEAHGNMGFIPAAMYFTEMRTSELYKAAASDRKTENLADPLFFPFPYVLSNGVMECENSKTKIPPHNPENVTDALKEYIKNPEIETKDLMKYLKGPDLPIGGEIINTEELCDIYEKGCGTIKIKVTSESENFFYIEDVFDYCDWYGLNIEETSSEEEWIISIPYSAFLYDGESVQFMSLKDILKKYYAFYMSAGLAENIDAFFEKLIASKKL